MQPIWLLKVGLLIHYVIHIKTRHTAHRGILIAAKILFYIEMGAPARLAELQEIKRGTKEIG